MKTSTVDFTTNLGDVVITLFDDIAPKTVANFLTYATNQTVGAGYTSSFFHRLAAGFVLQGGGYDLANNAINTIATRAPVANEFRLSNIKGTVAMAKLGSDPNSATDQFFINLADNASNLDAQNGGFTVFGAVTTASFPVVQTIANLPTVNYNAPFDQLPVTNYTGGPLQASNLVVISKVTVTSVFTSPDPLFDVAYYLAHNPDVAAAGVDPYQHYLTTGWKEGRNPDALFDDRYYLTQNPDVAAAGINPLTHFEQSGWREGRQPSLLFDDAKYLAANPDVRAAGIDPLLHYIQSGQNEGRAAFLTGGTAAADPLVDTTYYDRQLGATLIPAGTAGAQQAAWSFDNGGWQKGLNPDAFFDTNYYLSHNADVAAAHIDPLLHFENFGWHEGRDASAQFSTAKYLAAYTDVRDAGLDPLLHYIQFGQAEGRSAFAV